MVGWVAVFKMAAMASYSAQGDFSVSISTRLQTCLPAIALPSDYFEAHIVGSANDRTHACAPHPDAQQMLTGPKFPQVHIPIRVSEDVRNVSNHVAVQIGHALQDLPGVFPGHTLHQGS